MKFKKNMILVVLLVAPILLTGSFKLFSQETMNIHKTDNSVLTVPLSEIEKITYGKSVQDLPILSENTVTDIDGNVYNTVKIGTQTWLQSDLKVTKFNDGTPIALIQDNKLWGKTTAAAYCWYDNKNPEPNSPYGAIYNGYAASMKTLCPKGWHVPTKEEFDVLPKSCGSMALDAARGLREVGTIHWKETTTSVTNKTGFTALPTGHRRSYGDFNFRGGSGNWWSSTIKDDSKLLFSLNILTYYNLNYLSKNWGGCVRCIKDEY
ncbi:MAG: fibrobacter succinogenes major paralogous domain-containing protein [Candidatus Delongbacteria bacterium]|nr:fibrobacter succinogenes major paralogous domain-containing protein [Candidatus Delongbacteria bacterium]